MKILVIRYRFIGDTVLMIPFLRNLRRAYPNAQIDVLVGPVSGDVLKDCPYVDELIFFDTTKKHRYENTKAQKKSFFSYVKDLKSRKYDKAYVLKRSLSSAILAFMAGIKQRIGFDTEGRGFLLTKRVPYKDCQHEVECILDVLRYDGIAVNDNYLENWVNPKSEEKISRIFAELNLPEKPRVLVHATSGNVNKEWPKEHFARIVEHLSNNLGMQVFYAGTQKDSEAYEEIESLMITPFYNKPINLCGKLSIQDSTALINRMSFVVGCDSGTLHIAASLNVPVIGLYGPMNPDRWLTRGDIHEPLRLDLECIPCDLRKKCKKDIACLKNITPEMVIEKINAVMKRIAIK